MEYYRGSISSLRSFCRYTSNASPLSTRTLSRDIEDESFGFTLQAVIILNLARAAKVELSLCVAKGFPDMALWHSRNQSPIFLSWKIWFRPVAPYWDHRTPHRANIPAQIPIRCLSFPNHINSSPIHLPSNSPPLQFSISPPPFPRYHGPRHGPTNFQPPLVTQLFSKTLPLRLPVPSTRQKNHIHFLLRALR